ncbi:bifunctional diaminohydroxyphosphoribosylaminopyrimidine deaminase/5-amino-6-(5-phosphoribosylamino)uracil reductase RibD [Ningiella sp. W23]|uniref:bifunctional diaminohydroxyphosphoribosylaminopyrimidine deaminase/5-amino-6-(5-phosphoribosylamino)uracil reductase RibD n=1 Tax=Ningiella sp. W23 TaxID=3023715 RepID=UPI003758394A
MKTSDDFSAQDAAFMAHALSLAEKGRFSTTPNPAVGCVIVDDDNEIVAQGYHEVAGGHHAEVNALNQAGDKAKNASVYVTLEPCAHHGRTGPCAEALVNAGVRRVTIASIDPNPLVAGKGMDILTRAGVDVRFGLMQSQASALNRAFFHRMQNQRPYVVLKLASSLDGKTALQNGLSQWITSEDARKDVQKERALSCAILTGSGTALVDNPRLNVRPDQLPDKDSLAFKSRNKQPLRVVIDGKGQLHSNLTLIEDGAATLIYNRKFNHALDFEHVTQVQIMPEKDERHLNLSRILADIGKRNINRLFVEAGAKLAGALLEAGLVDELLLYIAPKMLGGGARELISGDAKTSLDQALETQISELRHIGKDIKIKCTFPMKKVS